MACEADVFMVPAQLAEFHYVVEAAMKPLVLAAVLEEQFRKARSKMLVFCNSIDTAHR